MQQLVLAPALEGQDVAGQAPTGSGKTAAYGLAVLQQVDPTSATMQALVLVPARELVLQVRDALQAAWASTCPTCAWPATTAATPCATR